MQNRICFRHNVARGRDPQQRWSVILLGASALGFILASVTLVFGRWTSALAIYGVCTLALAVLLSWLSGQEMHPRAIDSVDGVVPGRQGQPPNLIVLERHPIDLLFRLDKNARKNKALERFSDPL